MSEWKEMRLNQIAKIEKKNWKVGDSDLPYIGLEHIIQGKLRISSLGKSSEVASNKYYFDRDCFLFGKLRPYFRKLYRPNFNGICSTDIWVVKPKAECDKNFLFYFFANKEFVDQSYSTSGGTRMPRADWKFMSTTSWRVPELIEQQAIAEVLSSLDDKIDLLNRQNKTLEQMAETLFRKWFIEDAKKEWEMLKVKDIAIHKKDSVNPSKNPFVEYKHYSLPAFDSGKRPQIELGSNIHSNKYLVHENSILVSKLNPRIPRIWLNLNNVDDKCICSTEFQVIKPKETEYLGFLFCLLKSDDAVSELEMSASGTSGSHQRVRPEDILNLCFNTPSIDRIIEFSKLVEPLLAKTLTNQTSINILEQKRDTLLPKLMSGEVRVKMN
jgi:type I restriction enzyme S subunit